MDTALELKKEVEIALLKQPDPEIFALAITPHLENAIQLSTTPEEVNGLRSITDMASTYCRRALPTVVKDRIECMKKMYPLEEAYVRASGKAGVLYKLENSLPGENWHNAGFMNSRDATTCIRIGDLIRDDQLDEYFNQTKDNNRHITIGGAENLWRMFHGSTTSTNVLSPLKELQEIELTLLGLIDRVQGDVQKNVRMMHRLCMDAIEIEREN